MVFLISFIALVIFALVMSVYIIIPIGSIVLIIWAICNRNAEKKREEIEHKDYKQY